MLAVIIPAYNQPDKLQEALTSLVLQNYKMFITIVVDDCSTENLKPIIDEFSNKLQLKYIKKEKNEGPGLARQTGIDWAYENKCDYAIFLDSDDLLYPSGIQDMYKTAKSQFAQVLDTPIVQENLKYHKNKIISQGNNWIWTHGKCYNLHFLKQYNIRFSENFKYNEDGFFNYEIKEIANKRIHFSQPCYLWRDNSESITRKKDGEFQNTYKYYVINGYVEVIEKLLLNNQLKDSINAIINIIYKHYEYYICSDQINQNNLIILQDKINKILGHKKIIKDFQNKNKIEKINHFLRGSLIEYKDDIPTLIMYQHNFYQWLEQFENGKKIKEFLSK